MINFVLNGHGFSQDVLKLAPFGAASAMVAKKSAKTTWKNIIVLAVGQTKLRFTEGRREGEPGQRMAERDTALYSRDPGGPFQEARARSDEVNYGEMSYFRWDDQHGDSLVCQSGS